MRILVKCMEGIGDNIYARPFIKLLAKDDANDVFVMTPLPELLDDQLVTFVRPHAVRYRTQQKSFKGSTVRMLEQAPTVDKTIEFTYSGVDMNMGIVSSMERKFGFELGSTQPELDLPSFAWHKAHSRLREAGWTARQKLAFIRPVTHRAEWLCTSRSPLPNYIAWCSKMLMAAGYFVVSVADCVPDVEWIEDDEPPAHLKLNNGELSITEALGLLQRSNIVVGGSGFIVPAAVAARTKLFVIFGGRGAYDNPHKVFDLRMDMSKIGWALPKNFCRCWHMQHDCDKTIPDLDHQFYSFMGRTS